MISVLFKKVNGFRLDFNLMVKGVVGVTGAVTGGYGRRIENPPLPPHVKGGLVLRLDKGD